MPFIPRRLRAALLATASATLVAATLPAPVPLGIGDSLFPHLGNPGYDVLSYDIGFTYHGNNKPLDAVTTIDARTTEPLDRINLDFARGTVRTVDINGLRADFATADEDLVVEAPGRLPAGVPLHITVRHTSDPSGDQNSGGWVRTSDGLAMANQADAAHRVFPSNDHPADKAYFTFRVTAPKELTVVANGLPAGKVRHGSSTTWTYRTAHPMATELAQVSIGRSTVLERTGPHGLPVRDVVPAADRQGPRTVAEEDAGAAGVDGAAGRPLPLRDVRTAGRRHEDRLRAGDPDALALRTVRVHHRRLPRVVRRLGHGARAGPPVVRRQRLPAGLVRSLAQRRTRQLVRGPLRRGTRQAAAGTPDARRVHAGPTAGAPPAARPPAPPPRRPARRSASSGRSCTTAAHWSSTRCARRSASPPSTSWNAVGSATHRDSTATTTDFVRLASQIAGRDLTAFFDGWLYGAKTPPMPGHPDWHSTQPAGRG